MSELTVWVIAVELPDEGIDSAYDDSAAAIREAIRESVIVRTGLEVRAWVCVREVADAVVAAVSNPPRLMTTKATYEHRIWSIHAPDGNRQVEREMDRMHNNFGWEVVTAYPRPSSPHNVWDMVLRRRVGQKGSYVSCPACAGAMPVHQMGLPLQEAHRGHVEGTYQPPTNDAQEGT